MPQTGEMNRLCLMSVNYNLAIKLNFDNNLSWFSYNVSRAY